jgi:hypothetical protein
MRRIGLFVLLVAASTYAYTQQAPRYVPEDHRPPLFFREGWKNPNGTGPTCADCDPKVQVNIRPDLVENPSLELRTYGPGKNEVQVVHHDSPKDDPSFIWTGMTTGNWAVALRDKNNYVDLTGLAKIRWRVKVSGFHLLRPVLKLADGTYLVGDHTEVFSNDWRENEFAIADVRWRGLETDRVNEARDGKWKDNVDLSKVEEIGFTDLSAGTGHGAGGSSRVDWIEVYGNPVKRSLTQQSRQ